MLLGIDSGQSTLKVAVYDYDGNELGAASTNTKISTPAPHQVERDMQELGDVLFLTIEKALAKARVDGAAINAIGITAHGDGLYLIDNDGKPVRPAILASDTRSREILQRWRDDDTTKCAVQNSGQYPLAGSLAPLVTWLKDNEPATLQRTRWILYCKDWLRYLLTGQIGTDYAEASSSIGNMNGDGYSRTALKIYELEDIEEKLPAIYNATDIVGGVTEIAASTTGLRLNTPVVCGTHDVLASALGSGVTTAGEISTVAGSWGVNQVILPERTVDTRFQSRKWVDGKSWVMMGASPSSASNLDWFIKNFMADEKNPFDTINNEVTESLKEKSLIQFFPYIYGSPLDSPASGTFIGVHAWHTRGHLLKALFEGVVFNHRFQVDQLVEFASKRQLILSGGVARSDVWTQMFADTLNCEVCVTSNSEPGCLGAAMLGGIGIGEYKNLTDAKSRCVSTKRCHQPDPNRVDELNNAYFQFEKCKELMLPVWRALK